MKKQGLKKQWIEVFLFAFVFVCILVATCSIYPKVDEHIFSVSMNFDFASIMSYALNYGNGRLIGNLICIFFSFLYQYKFIFVSLTVTVISICVYKLFFKDKPSLIIPITFLVIFPAESMYNSLILDFPSFTNYVVPAAFISAALLAIKNYKSTGRKVFNILIISISTILSCLFSENTTVIVVLLSLSILILGWIQNKKISVEKVFFFVSSLIGSMVMILIPVCTGTSEKLSSYHAVTFSISDIFGNTMLSTDIINDFVLIFFIISFCISYITIKSRKLNSLDWTCISVMFLYIVYSLLFSDFEVLAYSRFITLMFTVIYLFAASYLIFKISDKRIRYGSISLVILAVLSAAEMVVINILFHRTFYITYYLLLILAMFLISEIMSNDNFVSDVKISKRAITVTAMCFFIIFSSLQCVSTFKKFDDYVIANENIKNSTSQTFEEKFGSGGFSIEIFTDAIENKAYYDPSESVLWPRDGWLECLK